MNEYMLNKHDLYSLCDVEKIEAHTCIDGEAFVIPLTCHFVHVISCVCWCSRVEKAERIRSLLGYINESTCMMSSCIKSSN